MTVTMDKAGRIVIPLKVRQRLHLKAGTEFDIYTSAKGIVELEPRRQVGRIVYDRGMPVLVFDDDGPANFDVVAEINRAREDASDYASGVGGYDRDDLG